jgi:hypothetical protein
VFELWRSDEARRNSTPLSLSHDQTIDITRFGAVGEVVEGSIGPVVVTSRRDGETNLTVRFRVCRIADWHVRGP